MKRSEKEGNATSEAKAKKFRLYKFIAISVLVLFLLFGLVIFENDITVENLRYLIKYLDFSSSGTFDEETVILYNADPSNRFHVFRGDLVIANTGGVTLYDRRGSAVMTDRFTMSNPVCVPSDRYLIVYDLGGHQVRVYNSFSLLFEKSFDYVIQSVDLNSDGDFCVVTSEKSYHSAVFVFDRDFKEIHSWKSSDKFAFDADLSDQDVLTVSTLRVLDGSLCGDLIALKLGKKDALSTYTFTDQMPLALSTDRKGTLLLTNENLIYLEDGQEVRKAMFPMDSLEKTAFGNEICAVIQNELSVGVNYRVRVFNRRGEELFSEKFSTQILDLEVFEGNVYILTHTGLFVLTEGEKLKEYSLTGEGTELGVLGKDTVILCSDTSAHLQLLK